MGNLPTSYEVAVGKVPTQLAPARRHHIRWASPEGTCGGKFVMTHGMDGMTNVQRECGSQRMFWTAALATGLFLGAVSIALAADDRDNNPPGPRGGPGTNWENPPGPLGGPGTSPDRRPWRVDRDNNPPGPRGGPGTNWENPPGPRGGPGASPDRRPWRVDLDNNPPGPRGGRGTNWENPPGPRGGPGASPDAKRWPKARPQARQRARQIRRVRGRRR